MNRSTLTPRLLSFFLHVATLHIGQTVFAEQSLICFLRDASTNSEIAHTYLPSRDPLLKDNPPTTFSVASIYNKIPGRTGLYKFETKDEMGWVVYFQEVKYTEDANGNIVHVPGDKDNKLRISYSFLDLSMSGGSYSNKETGQVELVNSKDKISGLAHCIFGG